MRGTERQPIVKPKHTPSDENSTLIFPDKVSVPAQKNGHHGHEIINPNS